MIVLSRRRNLLQIL